MGKTIRTIIVLLAAVMLLAGCDPKMGNQGGTEQRTGETLNGIEFSWYDTEPHYETDSIPDVSEYKLYKTLSSFGNDALMEESIPDKVEILEKRIVDANNHGIHCRLKPAATYGCDISDVVLTKCDWRDALAYDETSGVSIWKARITGEYHHKGTEPEDTHTFIWVRERKKENDIDVFFYDYLIIDGKYYTFD